MIQADQHLILASPVISRLDTLLGEPAASSALACLEEALDWQQPRLRLFGREHPIPRHQVWMGDPEARYRYSGRDFSPDSWHPLVVEIRDAVVTRLGRVGIEADFNSVLLNRYGNGQEHMGWHSDDELELGPSPLIAAVSFGSERPLRFRWKHKEGTAFNVWLPHDSLLLMGAGVQARLEHALLPRKLPGCRISLTFRLIHD